MTGDGQLDDPGAALASAATDAVPLWLRLRAEVAWAADGRAAPLDPDVVDAVTRSSDWLAGELTELLSSDVDEQRTTPLSIVRRAGAMVAAELERHGVPATEPPPHADVATGYGLAPASWSDVDQSLHEPGLVWGAWKAMTILRRRRDEGLR